MLREDRMGSQKGRLLGRSGDSDIPVFGATTVSAAASANEPTQTIMSFVLTRLAYSKIRST
jgi:hypothetical protein